MKQHSNLPPSELKAWFLKQSKTDLINLQKEELAFLLETLTPYKDDDFYPNNIRVRLLTQWIENEETWEEYPVSRKTMFERYKDLTGSLPEVTMPTLELFNYFIGSGYTHLVCS